MKKNTWLHSKQVVLVFLDILVIVLSMVGALWIRLDFRFAEITPEYLNVLRQYMIVNIVCTLALNLLFHLYHTLWQFASIVELRNIVLSVVCSTAAQFIGMHLLKMHMPRSYPLLYMLLLFIFTVLVRYIFRIVPELKISIIGGPTDSVRTLIIGAGEAGRTMIEEMQNSAHVEACIVGLVDDDPQKQNTYLRGIPVLGTTEEIPAIVERFKVKEIIFAIPTARADQKKRILNICQETGCKVRMLPGLYQLIDGTVHVSMLREVEINDLLGREPINLDSLEVREFIRDKVVLVTGGGGSIGSEICRQVAASKPKLLIILDIYENNAFDIRGELLRDHPDMNLEVLIGSVRNKKRVDSIFAAYHPDLVFHAAAHKHVPLMEDSPNESIKNNVLGTWLVADAARVYGARKMVLISTDKAVRPTNIMGASKRICELVMQSFAQRSQGTEYAAVRFGNVLGSNGSVVPIFKKQIAKGGPVTVTHPDIIRYFMTIPEAVNLVLQCGTLARGGEIFILDMGDPVKILDLAKNMIRLSGLEPDKDIKIEFTGLRPGEKLYEELLISLDNLKKTDHDRIFVAQQTPVDVDEVADKVKRLIDSAFDEAEDIREQVKELVPEYTPKKN